MPDPIVLAPGESTKIISQPPKGSAWHVQVDGADVYLSHNPQGTVREGQRVLPGDRVRADNLQGRSYYAKNPPGNTNDAEIEVSRADAFLDFLTPFTQHFVRDETGDSVPPATSDPNNPDPRQVTQLPAESLDHSTKIVSETVADNGTNETIIAPPDGEVWEIHTITVSVPSTSGASTHTVVIEPEQASYHNLLEAQADGSNQIVYDYGGWNGTHSTELPSDPALQFHIINGLRIDSTDGLVFRYINGSGSDQTDDRRYGVYARRIEVSQ